MSPKACGYCKEDVLSVGVSAQYLQNRRDDTAGIEQICIHRYHPKCRQTLLAEGCVTCKLCHLPLQARQVNPAPIMLYNRGNIQLRALNISPWTVILILSAISFIVMNIGEIYYKKQKEQPHP